MKIKRDDQVVVIQGRDKSKTGKVLAVLPQDNKLLVEGVNVIKRHTKPSQKNPRGGILDVTKPIDASKVMVLDPASGLPARVGYSVKPDGSKERVFKVSPNHKGKTKAASVKKKTETEEKAGQK
jgi:large subunit ribosomal protein L24